MRDLGEIIKKERMVRKESQETLANQIGVSRQTILNWEKSKTLPDSQSLVKIAERYQLSFDELIGIKSKKKQSNWKKYGLLLFILSIGLWANIGNNTFLPTLLFLLLLLFFIEELFLTK